MSGRRAACTIYVGNLPIDVRESEIEELFRKLQIAGLPFFWFGWRGQGLMAGHSISICIEERSNGTLLIFEVVCSILQYGNIVYIDMKLPSRPPGYCFVEFEDPRDAENAIRSRDGYYFDGLYLRVELAHGGRGVAPSSSDRSRSYNSGRAGISRRAEYRVMVSKLPATASWQDLKDHKRKAGDVCYAQVFREGGGTVGVVDYTNYDDMKYAIRKLDDSEFQNRYSQARIRVYEDKRSGSCRGHTRSPRRSRSYSRGPSNSQSRSPSKSCLRSKSPSRAHHGSVSRSQSASHARSASGSPANKHSESPEDLKI